MPTALIDGDIIAYQVAAMAARPSCWDDEQAHETYDEADVRQGVDKMVEAWREAAACGTSVVLLTGKGNFRKTVDPTYKANRKDKARPAALGYAREYLTSEYEARAVDGLEADDLIGLMLTGSMADGKGVAVSLDKDLRTIPGLHVNPDKDSFPVEVALVDADRFWMRQVLTGDPTDGYGGAKRIGPVKADAALANSSNLPALWSSVLGVYAKTGQTSADALRTARLARILRRGDYNRDTREVRLWTPSGEPDLLALPAAGTA